jgi:hypothetical protein
VDTVIGSLGRGEAPEEAYLFAREVAAALAAGNLSHPSLKAMDSPSLEAFISELNKISPRAGRLGSGREEPDGAVSFLVHFLGRERGITGELYVRAAGDKRIEAARQPAAAEPAGENGQTEEAGSDGASETTLPAETTGDSETAPPAETAVPAPSPAAPDPAEWQFEDLILEEARERGMEDNHRFDFPPYERFF